MSDHGRSMNAFETLDVRSRWSPCSSFVALSLRMRSLRTAAFNELRGIIPPLFVDTVRIQQLELFHEVDYLFNVLCTMAISSTRSLMQAALLFETNLNNSLFRTQVSSAIMLAYFSETAPESLLRSILAYVMCGSPRWSTRMID